MNNIVNILARRLVGQLLAGRHSRTAMLVAALIMAILTTYTVWKPDNPSQVPARTAVQAQDAYALAGRVVRVADGDTFTLLVNGKQERIRLASIDAPETTKDADRPGQPYAQASKDALAALIAGKSLSLKCYERDRYERNVCDVPLDDGTTANQKQVASGMAWANMEGRGKFMRDAHIPSLEQKARRGGKGVWQDAGPIQPWVWRNQCWQQHQC